MRDTRLPWLLFLCLLVPPARAEKVTIYRDEFGVPHIFARTLPGVAYGSGYAQAEDRLEELLRNYRRAEGTMSEAFDEKWLRHDYRQRLWRHAAISREKYREISLPMRQAMEAYIEGVRRFMKEHPEQVPAWAPELDPAASTSAWRWPAAGQRPRAGLVVVALGRYIIWGWPEGEAGADLRRAKIEPDPALYRGSNEWLVAPQRTAMKAVIALIDPHLSWYGEFRFYEVRLYAGDFAVSGAAIPYADQVRLIDQAHRMKTARNLEEMKQALAMLQLMAQNIMVGTVQGDIYYVRNGRVPIRAQGANPSFPIPGHTSANEWKGIHPFSDLVQIANPPQGYMQNCNISPFGLMKDSPLTPEKYAQAPYLYNDSRRPNHQRAQMVLELLDEENPMTPEKALDIAFSPRVYQAELWQARVKEAWERAPDSGPAQGAAEIFAQIQRWNRRSDAHSVEAMAYRAFKVALGKEWGAALRPPSNLSDAQVLEALAKAARQLHEDFGGLQVPYGRLFRVGREGGGRTYPVGGGSLRDVGMATPRAIGFSPVGKEMVGRSGQTSTQLVILSSPPKSFSVIPLGESDHPQSGHWNDQAEKLFSQSKMKPSYFLDRKELLKHVTGKKVLEWGQNQRRGAGRE